MQDCDCIYQLIKFINLCCNVGLPLFCRKYFCSGRLNDRPKQNGGLRPIAVGLLLRILISWMLAHNACPLIRSYILLQKLVRGLKSGTEAITHAVHSTSQRPDFESMFFYKWMFTMRLKISLARVSSALLELYPPASPDGSITVTPTMLSIYMVLSLFSVPPAHKKVFR